MWTCSYSICLTAGDLDDCFDVSDGSSCVPYHVSCTDGVIQSGQSSVDSQCFTFHGQSGSPVWLYYSANSTRIIRGVLASADTDGGDGTFYAYRPGRLQLPAKECGNVIGCFS